MNAVNTLVALRVRLAKAQADRDTWRVAGLQDQYLTAYFLVEALELQIEQLLLEPEASGQTPR
ncbi:MAG TPA: hypothetical protein VLI72_04720 [Methylibium sp.]|nr:hypothetical protein [Methylibium sp.]